MRTLLLIVAYLWIFRTFNSLPKVYHYCCNKRDIQIAELRKFERICLRVTKLRLDILYFQRCADLKICPKFLLFKRPKLKAYRRTENLQAVILRNQIDILKSDLTHATNAYLKSKTTLSRKLSILEYALIISQLDKRCKSEVQTIQQRHQQKLTNLWRCQRTPAPDCLLNFSDRRLSIEEENALRLGLKHHILPKSINGIQIKSQVEQLVKLAKDTVVTNTSPTEELNFKEELRHSTLSFLHSAKNVCGTRYNLNFHKTLKLLRSDPNIKVCSFDKGNGIVILNSKDYSEKLDTIILDETKFQEITVQPRGNHPVIRNENSIRTFLREKVKPFIPSKVFDSIYPSGSQPGKVYGLCKAHKPGMPLRPVVSMINTAEYQLAKYLDFLIKPHIPSHYMLDSTVNFLKQLSDFKFSPTDTLVSFDVVSLFTNVPLGDTIHLIADYIYSSNSKPPFDKATFVKLLEIATGGLFMHQGRFYKQIDGVTMGSPLGPTLANFCLAHYENRLLKDQDHAPILYLRYVDDIFCVFRNHPYQNFLDKLNTMHPNLKFTAEIGPSTLPFLDTAITLPDIVNGIVTSQVYRKPTFTGLMLNFSAMCPFKWKRGLIQCMLHRAYTISSNWSLFDKEVDFLKRTFAANGYPTHMFNSLVEKFLSKKFEPEPKPVVGEDGVQKIFCLPYIGQPSIEFSNKVRKLFKSRYLMDIKIVYTSFKVRNYFSLKCRTPLPLVANVIYKFQCSRDANLAYVGKTKRHLVTRVKEHGTASTPSAIREHLKQCDTCRTEYSINNFRIIDSGKNDFDCCIKEALHIKLCKPTLNTQLSTQGMSFFLNIF